MGQENDFDFAKELVVEKEVLAPPPMYKVILNNDDYTPMDFVVEILRLFFVMSEEQAVQLMLTVHNEGKAVCGVYSKDVAESKAMQINQYARENQHPLLCSVEKG
ncbi:ATP-dependent Clp protease adapter ClpS [Paraferrimonas sedimenticola]|uniref:ATP-dependent Clp protease adapter protein ClpS n=1 Tax=Paraferrimonas sedimenticola TaxID=375674 RepID=A0AA37RYI5_9GAMM|nr:ATP-dependent Clp protease adapter ClpS [Paraferrimonas sedimenticola]GLP97850.1 hypothetical protein GCM10007895_31570 [Paraferrimonas sedimenticola]